MHGHEKKYTYRHSILYSIISSLSFVFFLFLSFFIISFFLIFSYWCIPQFKNHQTTYAKKNKKWHWWLISIKVRWVLNVYFVGWPSSKWEQDGRIRVRCRFCGLHSLRHYRKVSENKICWSFPLFCNCYTPSYLKKERCYFWQFLWLF